MSNLWLIRASQYNNRQLFAEHFVSGGYIAIGWGHKMLPLNKSRERLQRWLMECHPEKDNININSAIGNIKRFLKIEPGDYVITPSIDNQKLYYAKVMDDSVYYFDETNSDDCPMKHRRKVHWKKMFDRRPFLDRFGIELSSNQLHKIDLTSQEFEKYLHEADLKDIPGFDNKALIIESETAYPVTTSSIEQNDRALLAINESEDKSEPEEEILDNFYATTSLGTWPSRDGKGNLEEAAVDKALSVGQTIQKDNVNDNNLEMATLGVIPSMNQNGQIFASAAIDESEDESGLEEETIDEEEAIPSFDPGQVKIRPPTLLLVDQLVIRVKHKEIDLEPDFQRLRGIWKNVEKSRFIESLMLRIPIPVFYVSADQEDNWAVVDGVQRMSTIYEFVSNEFPLINLEYMHQYNDCRYESLPRSLQRRISETQLMVNVIEPGTPTEVMFNIFTRINTGGTQLNAQEIRHALNPGPVREFLKNLANSPEFIKATYNSVNSKRMDDRECVLRFLAFRFTPPEEYSASKLDTFLMEAMKKINQSSCSKRTELAEDFKKSMRAAYAIFDDNAFRKQGPKRYRVNQALFETWSVQLANCSHEEIDKLVKRRQNVQEQFAINLKDTEFANSISFSTSNPKHIWKRFQVVEEIVRKVIDAS